MNIIEEVTQQSEKYPGKIVNIRVIITNDYEIDDRTKKSLNRNLSAMASWLLRRLKEKD
jgi:hypothetical protein